MINIIRGSVKQPTAAENLVSFFEANSGLNGVLYLGYPIIGTIEGAFHVDAVLISEDVGVVAFNLVEGHTLPENYVDIQDNSFLKLESKLKQYPKLNKKRKMIVELNIITFAPFASNGTVEDDYPVAYNDDNLLTLLKEYSWDHKELYSRVLSAIQSITGINKKEERRTVTTENSRGA